MFQPQPAGHHSAMTLSADFRALNDAITRIDTIHRDLTSDRSRLGTQVGGLLDGEWTGAAAAAFSAGWSEWCEDSAAVLAALDDMRALMAAALVGLRTADEDAVCDVGTVRARLDGE